MFIGIDPGASGGIATLDNRGSIVQLGSMPETDADIMLAINPLASFAVLEHVWSSPGWGHVGAFKFGLSYGSLHMALSARGVPFEQVLPRTWQKLIGVSYPKGVPRDKNITKAKAQQLFPGVKITHATADALLLAEFARRTFIAREGKGHHDEEENRRTGKGQGGKVSKGENRRPEPLGIGGFPRRRA